jgi:thiamine pyrophosphokinase
MTAVIVCNGNIDDYAHVRRYFNESAYVIGVDGGAAHLRKLGINPDIMVGDFDSIRKEDFKYFKDLSVEILEFPSKKDKTDTEIAVELAIQKGFKEVVFIGGLGSRMDHSLANVFILKKMLDNGIKGTIVDKYNEITLIDDKIELKREKDAKVTLLSLAGKTEGVTTKGLLYSLENADLELGSSWGVSNEFVEESAEITIKNGLLLVIKSVD